MSDGPRAATRRSALAALAALLVPMPAFTQSGVSPADANAALRQALTIAARRAIERVGRTDGYWLDGEIRIPLPQALARVQRSLAPLGLSAPLDDLQLKMNRAAERAAPQAVSLFTQAVRGLTVDDALSILRGGDTAATSYLRTRTQTQLAARFRPPIAQALDGVGALAALDAVAVRYGAEAALGARPRDALTDFAVEKALDGLFTVVAREERAIRRDPAKRATSLLRRVFGAL